MKEKVKEWYTKPRSGYIFRLSMWILKNPQALEILLIMSYFVSLFVYTSLFVAGWYFGWGLWSYVLFGLLIIWSLRKLWMIIRLKMKNKENIFTGLSVNDLWRFRK